MAQLRGGGNGSFHYAPSAFDGPTLSGADIQFYGFFSGRSSMANVSKQLAAAMTRRATLTCHSLVEGPFSMGSDVARQGIDPQAPIGFFYGLPSQVRDPVWGHATRIIGFACETDLVPKAWAHVCNRFHLVIVPSQWCARALARSGVERPILVVHHGLEPYYVSRRADHHGPNAPFIFYDVVNGHLPERKALRELLVSFGRAFEERTDVQLRLQTVLTDRVREQFELAAVSLDDPRILLHDQDNLRTADFASIYSQVDCTVHPAHTEGFSLIPLQSIACETPVIASAATGAAEYLTGDNSILLHHDQWRTDDPLVYYRTGCHPMIDEDHLMECLRYAESNWQKEVERVRRAAGPLRECFSWRTVLSPLMRLLNEVLNTSSTEERQHLLALGALASAKSRIPQAC